ncbi:MAG: hypothetical protein NTW87_18575 [Planctomycetota bacterium]|nr:hypothetical protein [Planctomycetota bacterium]
MKVVFVGGGSFRTLPVVRAAMAEPHVFRGGEICLVDFNLRRVETVGRLIMKTPEYAGSGCAITWTDKIDKALPGADVVSVSFPVGSAEVCQLSDQACAERGFCGSDQLSVSGAFRAVTGGTIVLDIARRMERHCPRAWLVDFANPVAVYSGMVNNHTKIKALGICGGFSNHRWDLTRLLFDKDEYCDEFKVSSAGVNHLSFIVRGTWHGKDIYRLLGERLQKKPWRPCRIPKFPRAEKSIRYGLARLVELYRRFGSIIFSTEGDGMMHIFFEDMRERMLRTYKPLTRAQIARRARKGAADRQRLDQWFRGHLDKELDGKFWAQDALQNPYFAANPADATVVVLKALSGASRQWLAASLPNRGAVRGFKDRTVLEYSMFLDRNGVHPEPDLEVPDCFHGLISALATHQTLLGDAIAARDPRLLAAALFAYPIHQNTKHAKALWRDLLKIHAREMPAEFQKAKDYF